jgi:hypothetical protein
MRVLLGTWEFVVGDDWRTAAGVLLALATTAALEGAGLPAWWACPAAAVAILWLSVRGAALAKRPTASVGSQPQRRR